MTQITRKSVPTRGLILLLAMFLGAGLVLSGCGDDDTTTTPAPAPPPPPPPAPEPEPEPEPPAPEAPATPTGLMVSATTETSITWTWDAVEGAIGYAVQVSSDEMFDETDTIHPSAEATFTASPLPPETSVYVRVAAAGGTLEAPILSGWTTHATGMSAMPPPPPPAPEAPGSPTGLMVSETTQTSITWTWDAVEGATGYAVQVSGDEMFDDMDDVQSTEETTFTASDLEAETSMFIRVAATAGTEEAPLMSGWTTHVTGMSAMPPPPAPAPEPPGSPTGLTTSETTETSITWTWDVVEGATGYAVQVSADEMFDDMDDVHMTAETTYTASDLEAETSMFVRVAATSDAGSSAWTTHVTGVSAMAPAPPPPPEPPGSPTGLMVSESTQTSITWMWNEVEGATGYSIQVSSNETFDDMDMTHATTETTYTASDLDPDTEMYVRVAATSDAGSSAWTTHVTGMSQMVPAPPPLVAPDAPTGLAVSGATDTTITWGWDEVMGADGYQVQFNTAGDFAGVDAMNVSETSHTQTDLTAGMEGHLRVRATLGSGDRMVMSEWTAHATASARIPPGVPMNLLAAGGDGSITWTWDATEHADSYDVQFSTDGVFTSDTAMENVETNSFTRDGFEPGTTAYVRVRASGGTGDAVRLMSGWAAPTQGMSAQIAIPPAPTGLTATSGDGSITWSWDEVAGATGYQVQVSTSEDFSGAETTDVEGTSHAADVDAGSTSYLRVRATGAGDPGAWSTHLTGSSNAPEPEPEPTADPIEVSFTVGEDDGFPMKPDGGTDKEKATAEVNAKMVVSSNYNIAITPTFIEGAAAVNVAAGDNNMPFAYVDWNALQSDVVDGGATFKIQKMAMGANQEMEPTGDVAYVACGPFECVSGDSSVTAPEITSMDDDSYTNWDPMLEVSYGWVDNDVFSNGADDANDIKNDGIDLGWITSSTLGMAVEHKFNSVPDGTNFDVEGPVAAPNKKGEAGKAKALAVFATDDPATDGEDENERVNSVAEFNGALFDSCDPASPGDTAAMTVYGFDLINAGTGMTSGLGRPEECFKIDADPDWLSGYSVEFTPQNDGVTWGEIDWFGDLEYEARTFEASDFATDICDMLFVNEVERAFEDEWTRDGFNTRLTDADGAGGGNAYIETWKVGPDEGLEARQFKTLWFDDDLDSDFLTADKPKSTDKAAAYRLKGANDLYGPDRGETLEGDRVDGVRATGNVNQIWQMVIDDDNDPTSDFGKVDLVSAKDDPTTADDETTLVLETCLRGVAWGATTAAHVAAGGCGRTAATTGGAAAEPVTGVNRTNPDGEADNMTGYQSDADECTMADNGDDQDEACDAELVIDHDLFFTDGTFGCEIFQPVTVTCTWDSNASTITINDDGIVGEVTTGAECKVEAN